ncbi:MAG: YafY family transcriptional regulator [Firmicutes bacterium]|nr:YafY family transcriptional regulator [Bacillota bacterium]
MKIDRLIGILSLMLQKERVTAREISEKFEVSRRTVLRDIESINMAGIPVASSKGKGGGFYIMEGYKIDKTLLSAEDMQLIFAGLKGLDSVSGSRRYRQLMDKLKSENDSIGIGDNIMIDLAYWDKSMVAEKLEIVKRAADKGLRIAFTYHSPTGESKREIEPYRLIFQWAGWYAWGYCLLRRDYRMFKLTRITDLRILEEKCEKREIPPYVCDKLLHTEGEIEVSVKFDKSVKWRIIDEFGAELPEFDSEGNSLLTFTWSDIPHLYRYLLSFGDNAEILSPREYRDGFVELLNKIQNKYGEPKNL